MTLFRYKGMSASSIAPVAKTDKVLLQADRALAHLCVCVWMFARVCEAQQEGVLGLGLSR